MPNRFTNLARDLAHAPFQGDAWQLMLWLYASPADLTMEKLLQGVRDTRVDDAEESFLSTIASQRGGILRGLTEEAASFRARLKTTPDDLRLAGNAWSILRQVLGYVSASQPRAFAVSSRYTSSGSCDESSWDEYATLQSTAKNPAHSLYTSGNWDWDSLSPTDGSWGWWRWYLVIERRDSLGRAWVSPAPKVGATGLKVGEPSYAVGVDVPSTVGKSLKLIVAQWKANWCHTVIVSFDGGYFDRNEPAGLGINPDGYFGRWSKVVGGVYARARFADARYFGGPV